MVQWCGPSGYARMLSGRQSASWRRKASFSDRKVNGVRATRCCSILALTIPAVLDLAENSHRPTRRREGMKQFKSTRPGSAFPRSPRLDQQPFQTHCPSLGRRNMMYRVSRHFVYAAVIGLCVIPATAARAEDEDRNDFVQTNLVSDIPGLATITDRELLNPWGISHSPTSPFWVSNQATSTSTLYSVTDETKVSKVNLTVAIPKTAQGPQGPTGQVNNANAASFPVGNGGDGGSAHFIFANLNGTISAWDTGPTAFIQVTTPGANYSGLAINQAQTQLYAANQAGTGSINVFNSAFAPVSLGAGAFATPTAIGALGLVPFNVQDINGNIYVTYAPSGLAAQRAATAGMGAVAVFTESGTLLQTIIGSQLAAPWGVTLAPGSFGTFGGDLLVGNFSFVDSEINAFNPTTGAFLGMI